MATIRVYRSNNGITYFYNAHGQLLQQIDTARKTDINKYIAGCTNVNFVDVDENVCGIPMRQSVPAPDQLAWHEKEITMPVKVRAAKILLKDDDVQRAIFEYVKREYPQIKPSDDLQTDTVITSVTVIITRKL